MISVGEILKKAREEQKIPLTTIEKQIKIREKFLKAVEANDWNIFTSTIYIKGVIKNYSNFLGLDAKKMLAFFRRDYEKKEEVRFKRRLSSQSFKPETKKTITIAFFIIILLFFIYFSYQLKTYLSPPEAIIVGPKSTIFTKEKKIQVIIKTEKEALVTIMGERIYQNKDGLFEYDLPLHQGVNDLVVEVVGANGKKTTLRKEFLKK